MKSKRNKIIAAALLVLGLSGLALTAGGWRQAMLDRQLTKNKQLISLKQYDLALVESKKIKADWFWRCLISPLRAQQYYELCYYQGVAYFKMKRYKKAAAAFINAGLSRDSGLNEKAKLAWASTILYSDRSYQKKIPPALEAYKKIITENITALPSWAEEEAKKRAYWIMANVVTKKGGQLGMPKKGQTGEEKEKIQDKKKALKKAFKRSVGGNKPLTGQ